MLCVLAMQLGLSGCNYAETIHIKKHPIDEIVQVIAVTD